MNKFLDGFAIFWLCYAASLFVIVPLLFAILVSPWTIILIGLGCLTIWAAYRI